MRAGSVLLLASAAMLAGAGSGVGQAPVMGEWRVGAGVGWMQHATRDRLASPQTFTGWGVPLRVALGRVGVRSAHELDFRFSSLALPARNGGPAAADELAAGLSYSYDRQVATGPFRTWYVGGAWVTSAFLRAYSYGGGEVWDGHSGLAVRGRVIQAFGGGRSVDVAGSFGLLGWSMRPPYSVEDNTTLVLHEQPSRLVTDLGRLTTPWSRPSVALQVRLTTPLWAGLAARASGRFEWSHDREPRPATTARSGFDVTLAYHFGGGRG